VTAAIEAHATDLLAFLARRITPAHEAADVLSEVFVVVWRRASSLPEDEADATSSDSCTGKVSPSPIPAAFLG